MPSLTNRGAISGKVFGLTNATSAGTTLQTVTFNSSTNWVAPATTTLVLSANGKGANGVSDYIGSINTNFSTISNIASGTGTSGSLPIPWNAVANDAINIVFLANGNNGLYASGLFTTNRVFYFYANLTFDTIAPSTFTPTPTPPSGIFQPVAGTWTVNGSPQSGNLTYGATSSYYASGQMYFPGNAGAASSAFGNTYPGGTYAGTYPSGVGSPATTLSFTNIAVTPGASYPITVPSGGTITIQFYA